jgi:hypothetical protein
MYAGNLNSLYQYKEMTTPYWQSDRQLCVEFYYTIIRPHEYSSTYLTIHQNISHVYREVFSLAEYRTDVTLQWHRGQFPVTAIPVEIMQFVRKDMDVSEHERQFNFTLRHKLM